MASRRIVSLLTKPGVWRCFSARRQDETIMNVFDRKAKRMQRNRAALAEDVAVYDYLKDEVITKKSIILLFGRLINKGLHMSSSSKRFPASRKPGQGTNGCC